MSRARVPGGMLADPCLAALCAAFVLATSSCARDPSPYLATPEESPATTSQAVRPLRFGFAPAHGATDASAAGRRLASYLSKHAGVDVVPFVASSYGTLVKGFTEGWVDVGWLPPLVYVMASRGGRAEPLAKFVRLGKGSYHGAFIVRAGSPFKNLASLRGRRMAYTDPRSSAGYLFPRSHLRQLGFDADSFFSQQSFLGSHKRVVEAVLEGQADVGVTFFSPLKGREPGAAAWTQYYPLRTREIRVIAQTPAIPSDVIAARDGCPPEVAAKVRAAFIGMADDPGGREILSGIFNAERAIPAKSAEYSEIERMTQSGQAQTAR